MGWTIKVKPLGLIALDDFDDTSSRASRGSLAKDKKETQALNDAALHHVSIMSGSESSTVLYRKVMS